MTAIVIDSVEADSDKPIGDVEILGISGTMSGPVAAPTQPNIITEAYGLFPTPVMRFKIGREFTETESEFFEANRSNPRPNSGNTTSEDRYILRNQEMLDLSQFFQRCIDIYMQEIISPKFPVRPYITQSWMNFTEPGQFHHRHEHPNSYLSGVFYVHGDPEKDRILFSKNNYEQISVPPKNFTIYNSPTWWLPAGTGDLLIFPSRLTHQVEQTVSDSTRISLSFNTFLQGIIGSADELTELVI